MIVKSTCALPTLGLGLWSIVGDTVVDVACICDVASVSNFIAPLFNVIERSNMGGICRSLCGVFMSTHSPRLVRHLLFCIVSLVICISSNTSTIGHLIAIPSSVHIYMSRKYYLMGITSTCSLSHRGIGQVITSRIWVGCESWKGLVYFAFQRL